MTKTPEDNSSSTGGQPPAGATEMPDLSAFEIDPDERDWALAEALYRSGDSDMLEKMLKSQKEIPRFIRLLLAESVSGTLKIDRRKFREESLLDYQQRYNCWKWLNYFKRRPTKEDLAAVAAMVNADNQAGVNNKPITYVTASDVRDTYQKAKKQAIADLAAEYGVTAAVIRATAKRFKPLPPTSILKLRNQRTKKR